jgi:Fe-S-cluster containining protein
MILQLDAAPSTNALGTIARPTPQLRATLAHQEAVLPPAEFAEMLAWVCSAFDKYTAKLLEFRAGAERATALHQMMDRELKAAAGLPVSCREGCSGCCHYEVEITQDEAELLKLIVQDGFPLDRDRLEEQASRERQGPEWKRFGSPQNRCVFLGKTGACQVYEDRPAICRKHLVTSPARACTTAGAAVAPVQVIMAEILLSAATSLEGATVGSLPKMLRAALQADQRQTTPGARTGGHAMFSLPPGRANAVGHAARPPAD